MMTIEIEGHAINIMVMDMVIGIKEQVSKNSDGSYTIFLNARYSHEALMKAYDHALDHIRRSDWEMSSRSRRRPTSSSGAMCPRS